MAPRENNPALPALAAVVVASTGAAATSVGALVGGEEAGSLLFDLSGIAVEGDQVPSCPSGADPAEAKSAVVDYEDL